MELKADSYSIEYDAIKATVSFQGSLLLNGPDEYASIVQVLNHLIEEQSSPIAIDLKNLRLLNSSGFQMLSKFVMKARQYSHVQLHIHGNAEIAWQKRSLQNLKRLMPSLQITLN